jgi:pyridoxamine 5'-phosphate oxidase family protein
MTFTPAELDYLRSQPLGRLATVDVDGVPQVNPVGFRITSSGDVLIGGFALAKMRKYRNVAATGRAALVIDDLASRDPWTVRGIEIRGRAEATTSDPPAVPGATNDVIRVHPDTIFTWGIESPDQRMTRRDAVG